MSGLIEGENRHQATLFPERLDDRDRNFTKAKMKRRLQQIDERFERYLGQIASADRQESEVAKAKAERLEDKIAGLKKEMARQKKARSPDAGGTGPTEITD